MSSKKRTIHAVKKSSFLTRADVDPPRTLTIREVAEEELDTQKGSEIKFVVKFSEPDTKEGLPLNWVNSQMIAKILGSESFDDWPGGKIVLYDDPSVMFGTELVGGIRVRAPKVKRPAPQPEPEQFEDTGWPDEEPQHDEEPEVPSP